MTALELSRKKNKSEEERQLLYSEITNLLSANNINELYYIFEPLIKKCCSTVCKKIEKRNSCGEIFFEDLMQDSYLLFTEMVNKYDASRSTFAYYLNNMFWRKLLHSKKYKYILFEYSQDISSYISNVPTTFEQAISNIFLEEYTSIIEDLKITQGRSKHTPHIIESYFFQEKSVQSISEEVPITYHAINQQVLRARYTLAKKINIMKYTNVNINIKEIYVSDRGIPHGKYKVL